MTRNLGIFCGSIVRLFLQNYPDWSTFMFHPKESPMFCKITQKFLILSRKKRTAIVLQNLPEWFHSIFCPKISQ